MSLSSNYDQEAKRKELQANWKIPSIAQFVSLYREGFKLPEIEIEDLEEGLISDESVQRKILIELFTALLKGINHKAKSDNWEIFLQKIVQKKLVTEGGIEDPYLTDSKVGNKSDLKTPSSSIKAANEEDSLDNLLGLLDQQDFKKDNCHSDFWKFKPSVQADIIYFLCLMRLDRSDAVEAMKKIDADALRAAPLGSDDEGNEYWYFYGTRLYKQEPAPLKKSRTWEDEWEQQKEQTFKKRRPGRPPKKIPCKPRKSDGESDELEETDKSSNRRFMNIEEKSRWSVVCNTIEDWVDFADKYKNSDSEREKALFAVVQENFLPALCDIYEEKERRLKQKIKELIPKRTPVITRMETRKHRTVSRYLSQLTDSKSSSPTEDVRKSRAYRLEERNRRVSERISRSTRNKNRYYNEDSDEIPDEISDDMMEISHEDEYVQKYFPLYRDGIDLKPAVMKLIGEVKLNKDAWPFINPVKKEDAPGYYEIISQPIDLSIITRKLLDGRYQNLDGLDADFRKLVMNCRLYNGEHSGPTRMVNSVYKMFTRGLEKIFDDYDLSKNKSDEESYAREAASKVSRTKVASKSGKINDEKRKKRKIRNMDAIEALSKAAELSLEKQNQDNYFESLHYSGFQQTSSFSDLKIIPISCHSDDSVKGLTSNTPNHEEANKNESSSYIEEEAGSSLEDFDLGNNSDSMPNPADYNYVESPKNDDNSNESVFADEDTFNNVNSQQEDRKLAEKTSPDYESRNSNNESSKEVQQRNLRNSSSSSEGLVHSMANILEECGNQNMSNLTSGFNREPIYSANDNRHSPAKSPESHHSDSSTPEQARKSPKDSSSPIQNSIIEKHVPFLQHGLNIQSDFGSYTSSNCESSTVDASVLGFSSFSTVPSRVSPLSVVQPEHKQTSPVQLPSPVASITTQLSPSSTSRVVAPSTVSQFNQNPVQILKPEPNKFPTVKVSLPPSTGEILVLPDKTDPNKMTFHLLAQPHTNVSQPIQSCFEIRSDRSSGSPVNEKESSPTTSNRRKSPMIETPFSTISNGMCMAPQPPMVSTFSNFLRPATTFSNFQPNQVSVSNAPSYTGSFSSVNTTGTNSAPVNQPAFQFVRPSNFNTLNANYSPATKPSNTMNFNIDTSSMIPQAGNIFKTMNSSPNSVSPNYQVASKEIKSKTIAAISKKLPGNVQKVTEVTASNNILFSSNSMLTSSNGQYEVISASQPGSRLQSSDRVMKTLPEGVTSSPFSSVYSNPMQNYTIASGPLNTPLMYAQVNPNQSSQLINIPNYMVSNQNFFQHPMNPSIMNVQPFQVPTRPIISMDMSNR